MSSKSELSNKSLTLLFAIGVILTIITPFMPSNYQGSLLVLASCLLGITIFKIIKMVEDFKYRIFQPATYILTFAIGAMGGKFLWKESNPSYPQKDGIIADFETIGQGEARNKLNGTFSIVSDSEYNGKSKCWYELVVEPQTNRKFMRLHFQLEPASTPGDDSYVGVFTSLSFPPSQPYDVSRFHGLELSVRASSVALMDDCDLVVSLPSDSFPKNMGVYNFCEATIQPNAIGQKWTNHYFPFSELESRGFGTKRKFNTNGVIQFALAIRSAKQTRTHGYIDIDDVRFK